MFTGLIEELGTVNKVLRGANSAKLEIQAAKIMQDIAVGDSIAINGACQTVVEFGSNSFSVDTMAETLARTNLGELTRGEKVNLERALRLDTRLGGHLVSGHVDAVGQIMSRRKADIAIMVEISAPQEILRLTVPKGSIAIDGISLTVIAVTAQSFSVGLIPHTSRETTLGFKKEGETVNLEADLLARYVDRLLNQSHRQEEGKNSRVTLDWLAENGFA